MESVIGMVVEVFLWLVVIWICFAIFRKLGDKRWEKRGELLDNYITLAWRASLARDRIAKLEATQGEYTGAFEALKWQVDCVDEYGEHDWKFDCQFLVPQYYPTPSFYRYQFKCNRCGKLRAWIWADLTVADRKALTDIGVAP